MNTKIMTITPTIGIKVQIMMTIIFKFLKMKNDDDMTDDDDKDD